MPDICTDDNDSKDSIVFDENASLASSTGENIPKKKMNMREIMRAISAVKAKTIGVYAADHVHRSQHTISIASEETACVFNGIRKNYKVSIRKCAENIVLCFCIICVMVVLYTRFVASFQIIRILTTK